MAKVTTSTNEFHIGLTMAGAVSAGCYTAGVMDYLFEILDLWEQSKENKLPKGWSEEILKYIPKHKVIIDVMGGASAGGMTTAMATIYALKGKINPVVDPLNSKAIKGNVLYDSWVLMGDSENETAKLFEKTMALDDLTTDKIPSLLNSNFIDAICDKAFIDDVGADKKRPNYISKQLEILLSQTMLRSVPLPIDFSTPFGNLNAKKDNPKYNTFEHFVISHFKLDFDSNNPLHKDFYLPLDPFNNQKDINRLKLATKATGAFPIGLSFRNFFNDEFSVEYIKNNSRKLINDKIKPENIPQNPIIEFENLSNPFQFVGVDGGAINNEPIGEVLNVLKERYGDKKEGDYDKFGLIMIDPFPNHTFITEYKQPDDIFSVIPSLLGTLQDQSKVKRREMLEFHTQHYLRGEIYPVRYYKDENENKFKREPHAIACSSAFAFGGFLDINFRHHDFFLGRDNARNFFKVYFSFEYDPAHNNVHPIHRDWTPEMVKAFKFYRKDAITGQNKVFLPIIPNLYELKDKLEKVNRNPYSRTVKEWPVYNPELLFAIAPKLENRIKKIIDITLTKFADSTPDVKHPVTEKWIEKHYHQGFFKKITGWVGGKLFNVIISTNKRTVAKKGTKAVLAWLLKDLEEKKLIQ
jgi:hypothetical protein